MEVGTALWCLTGSSSYSAKEGIKDITKAGKVKAFKASSEKSFGTTMSEAVIGSAFIGVREHFKGFVYLLKFFPGIIITVMVGVILKG
ncbi:hypothetical protein ES703_94821 [subsurface metagenome]